MCRFFDGAIASSMSTLLLPVTVVVMPCSDGDNAGDAESLAKIVCTALELRPKSGLSRPYSWNYLFASPPVDQVRKGREIVVVKLSYNPVTICNGKHSNLFF